MITEQRTFTPMFHDVISIQKIKCKDGQLKVFSSNEKITYLLMLGRYEYFSKNNGSYYDSQAALAEMSGIPIKTLQRVLDSLEDFGLITINKTKGKNNTYVVHDLSSVSLEISDGKMESKRRTTSFTKDNYVKNERNTRSIEKYEPQKYQTDTSWVPNTVDDSDFWETNIPF